MRNKLTVTIFLLAAALIAPVIGLAVASDDNAVNTGNGGYTITPATGLARITSPMLVHSSVTQGQTNWHANEVSGYCTSLHIDLNWGNVDNSLRLRIHTADGFTLGPYYDDADGLADGRINIYVNNPAGIAQGTWYYEVYGYSVTGTQSYTI